MRYSRMEERQPQKSGGGRKGWAVVVIIAAIAIGVYLIGAAKVGDFLAKNVVDPVAQAFSQNDDAPQASEQPTQSAAQTKNAASAQQVDIEIGEFTLYAIQAGVFSDEANARQYADELTKKGGAGFVTQVDDGYRVYISGYMSKEDATGVKNRLIDEQDMDTSVYEMKGDKISVCAQADENTAKLLDEADINGGIEELTSLSLSRDKGEITAEQAREKLTQISQDLQTALSQLNDAGNGSLTQALIAYFEAAHEGVERAVDSKDDVELSSAMKYAYLSAAYARSVLSNALPD